MSQHVHDMFENIAPRYDKANDALSFGVHRLWRQKAVELSGMKPGAKALDLCTGTGDFAFELARKAGPKGEVLGIDFVQEMIQIANQKLAQRKTSLSSSAPITFRQGDALNPNVESNYYDIATVGFGIRNVDDVSKCLKEMKQALKPGGVCVVLEFGQPEVPVFKQAYQAYSKYLMPHIGGIVTGNKAAYEYLPETSSKFPCREEFLTLMQQVGFSDTRFYSLFLGIAYIYIGVSK